MLARTFFVRKLIPTDLDTYNTNPAAYQGEWTSNPEGDVGEAVSEHMFTFADETLPGGVRFMPMLGVIWAKGLRPAMTYENPTFMENVDDIIESKIDERVEERLNEMEEEDDDAAE